MRYKHFKNAGVSVSALAVGTWAARITARSTGVIRYEPYEP